MTGALVLVLPGVLCAVMAWDLTRPTPARGRPRLRERAVAAALAVAATSCLLAAVWDATSSRGRGVLGAVCLGAAVAITGSRLHGRRRRPRQAAVPAQRARLCVPAPVPLAPTAPDRAKEPA